MKRIYLISQQHDINYNIIIEYKYSLIIDSVFAIENFATTILGILLYIQTSYIPQLLNINHRMLSKNTTKKNFLKLNHIYRKK